MVHALVVISPDRKRRNLVAMMEYITDEKESSVYEFQSSESIRFSGAWSECLEGTVIQRKWL